MAKISKFRRDPERAVSGRWCRYREDVEVAVASTTQEEWKSEFRRAVKKVRQEQALTAADDPPLGEVLLKCAPAMAKWLVKGWKNIEDDSGAPVPFSIEKASEYLSHPDAHEFREWVYVRSSEYAEFQIAARDAEAKN
jgi:hypothetical protein